MALLAILMVVPGAFAWYSTSGLPSCGQQEWDITTIGDDELGLKKVQLCLEIGSQFSHFLCRSSLKVSWLFLPIQRASSTPWRADPSKSRQDCTRSRTTIDRNVISTFCPTSPLSLLTPNFAV